MAMTKIKAPFDSKNLLDDSLRDDVFQGCYQCADMKGRKSHMTGPESVSGYGKDDLYLDCIVDAQWSSNSNTIRIELLACPCQEDFSSMREDFFKYYEQVFKEWECPENRDLRVEFSRENNVLYVSFFFECED